MMNEELLYQRSLSLFDEDMGLGAHIDEFCNRETYKHICFGYSKTMWYIYVDEIDVPDIRKISVDFNMINGDPDKSTQKAMEFGATLAIRRVEVESTITVDSEDLSDSSNNE